MRTKISLLSAAVFAAGIVASSAQVYSVNVVGYVNTSLQGTNRYTLISNPLDNKVSNAYSNLFNGLPAGTQVQRWTGTGFSAANRAVVGAGWLPIGAETNTVVPGQGVFVRSPVGSGPLTNTFVGEVLQGALANVLPVGYSLEGNMVPVAGTATQVGLTAAVPASTQILKWNPATQGYSTHNRSALVSPTWLPSEPTFIVGEGFFVRNVAATNVTWNQNFTVQ